MFKRSFLLLLLPVLLSAVEFPKYRGWVNDFAGVIPSGDEARMTAIAHEVKQKTGAEIAVVTVPDLQGLSVEDYANQLFRNWRIGSASRDNGVLILLAMNERKFRIEVGYGLESTINDGRAGEIRDGYMKPYFQQGRMGAGLYQGLLAVAGYIAKDAGVTISGEQAVRQQPAPDGQGGRSGGCFPVIFIVLLIIFTRGRIIPWLLLGSMMGGSGRGGGFSGGGFSGGFGGFGGGSSGGGGASGSW